MLYPKARTLGVDFGTSNSAAAILVDGMPKIIEIEAGQSTLPTSVFFDFATSEMLVGTAANLALKQGFEGRYMRSLKSVLGTTLMHEKRYLMGEELTFVDIISRFLHRLKSQAEARCSTSFETALSGRPVHFHSADPRRDDQALADLKSCYLAAGFADVQFMFEPEAAAIANGRLTAKGDIGLIVDIGGGTSDFSLFQNGKNGIDTICNHGARVGGTDFDKSISIDHVMPLFGKGSKIAREMGQGTFSAPNAVFQDLATWQMIPFLYSGDTKREVKQLRRLALQPELFGRLSTVLEMELGHDVAFAVETGKIQANRNNVKNAIINLDLVEPALCVPVESAAIAKSLDPHVHTIRKAAQETLALANCPPNSVSKVVFVGGSSLMAAIEIVMTELFPNAEMVFSDAFTAIVDGLAIAAGQPNGAHLP